MNNMQRGETRCVWRVWRATKSFIWDCKNKCSRLYEETLRLTSATVCAQWLHRRGATRCVRKVWEAGKSFISDCKNKYSRLCEENPRLPSTAVCAQWLCRRVCRIIPRKCWVPLMLSCVLTWTIAAWYYGGLHSEMKNETLKSELRIVLMGKAGTGKSSIRSAILGQKKFVSNLTEQSVTKECSKEKVKRNGRGIMLVDAPGYSDTDLPPETVAKELCRCVRISSLGPHAILLVLHPGHYITEERKTVEALFENFGELMMKYVIFLFSYREDFGHEEMTVEYSVKDLKDERLQELIEKCGNRYYAFHNRASKEDKEKQVSELITMIDKMVEENNDTYYSNEICIQAEALIKKKKEELEREKQKLHQEFNTTFKKIQEENRAKEEELRILKQEKAEKQQQNQIRGDNLCPREIFWKCIWDQITNWFGW
ncbi:GTPase IMAP family member 9 isoform X2 [Microcaecilia unicolor]|uniref:GTPase IMAP family member 9-like isoform X2 n=1 Tax=Microcaecilia unicolor TaxID=1415580 RepID=A0A6P7X7S3_9AMPH|nr:GTPase IMAP family member 9-like isoform X2 [Microcaecilia unicolor]